MMEENREGLGMKVVAAMVQRYGVLPRDMWDLNRISDMGAGRGLTYDGEKVSRAMLEKITSNNRYSIVNLTIGEKVSHKVELPGNLRQLKILAKSYNCLFDLPETLQELTFSRDCSYNKSMALPAGLRKLKLSDRYTQQLKLPAQLAELEFGYAYYRPLVLPPRLKRLAFPRAYSQFNSPLALPASLVSIHLNDEYNQPTVLPSGIEAIRVGEGFTHDLSLPDSLRKIVWSCNRPIHIPEGVVAMIFDSRFNNTTFSHPLTFPTSLKELDWQHEGYDGLVLPEGLQKLAWESTSNVVLPSGLRELVIKRNAPLILPEGLRKVTFGGAFGDHYILPESVQEVSWSVHSNNQVFTHPTVLQHLFLEFSTGCFVDLSHHRIHKLTIAASHIRIDRWPQGLTELAFSPWLNKLYYPMRVPHGCTIVGAKRPTNVW